MRVSMTTFTRTVLFMVLSIVSTRTEAQFGPTNRRATAVQDDHANAEKLRSIIDVDFFDATLHDVLDQLSQENDIAILLNEGMLDLSGIDPDETITFSQSGISLRSALNHMLRGVDLTFVGRTNFLEVTTIEGAEAQPIVRCYPVRDLVTSDQVEGRESLDHETLIELIQSTVAPESWGEVGGSGTVCGYSGILVFSQLYDVHVDVGRLLDTLRKQPTRDQADVEALPIGKRIGQPKWYSKIQNSLDENLELEFFDTSLEEVVEIIREQTGIPIHVDTVALELAGIDSDETVTAQLAFPLRESLDWILDQLNLTFTVDEELLLVTTIEDAEIRRDVRVYPVAGLMKKSGTDDHSEPSFGTLVDTITTTVSPESWESVGGTGSIASFPNRMCVVVSQTESVHHEIEQALRAMFKTLRDPNAQSQSPF